MLTMTVTNSGDCVGVVQEYVDFPTPDQYD